jgi:DNA-binding transcriptional MerR regulator
MAMANMYRINDLARLAALALEDASFSQNSGRIREVPDVRTIRYYTTLGLLDRPLEMQGRTAFYGPRHLLQLLAVKQLQAEGRSLTQIQHTLAGADDRTLHGIVALPEQRLKDLEQRLQEEAPPRAQTGPRAQRQTARHFWTQQPQVDSTAETQMRSGSISPAAVLRLGPGVTLFLEGVDAVQPDERVVTQLQPAIDGLLQALQSAGLTATIHHEPPEAER